MPYYRSIRNNEPVGRRTAEGLLRLNKSLSVTVPERTLDQTLLLASWNIREFGGTKSGGREDEPLFYLAEIISRFDLVAVQEVRDDLDALDQLMYKLGSWWKYLVSDVTIGRAGNNERHAFIYDTRKVSFGGLVGELVPPGNKNDKGTYASEFAFARTPFLAGFRAGWFKFTICTQHFYYGKSVPDDPQRLADSKNVVELLKKRMKSKDRWANNAILLGDFNVFTLEDETFKALESNDFVIPSGLRGQYTNAKLDKPFDQMAFVAPEVSKQMAVAKTGVYPFFDYVYRDDDQTQYLPGESYQTYKEWRTYKMSDHLPIWVELGVDFSEDYLKKKTQPTPASEITDIATAGKLKSSTRKKASTKKKTKVSKKKAKA